MKQFVIDGNKVVLSVASPDTRVDEAEFEENEVYSIDIVMSTGEGKVIVLAVYGSYHLIRQFFHSITYHENLCGMCSQNCWMRNKRLYIKELLTRIIT